MPESIEANSANAITGLFKYFSPDKLDFFENSLVLLTPPKYLNDPWDFLQKGRIRTDEEITKECQKFEKDMVEGKPVPSELAQLSPEERRKRFYIAGKSQAFVEEFPNYSKEKISQTHGIVSFTEKPSCRLMWTHYAGSHTGFVAKFVTQDQIKKEGRIFLGCINAFAAKVEYPPSFKLCSWTSENICDQFWSKHPDWEYEQEWRIVWELSRSISRCEKLYGHTELLKYYCLPFEPANLMQVIFGMRIKQEDQQRLHLMLNQDEFRHVQKQVTAIDNETGELILKPLT